MIVTNVPPEERQVPHEPGNFMSFRPLSAKQLDEVRERGQEQVARIGKIARSLFTMEEIKEAEREAKAEAATTGTAAEPADPLAPLTGLDRDLLVRYGVVAWRGLNYDALACDGEAKDALDERTRDWAALSALEVSRISQGEAESSGDGSATNGTDPHRSAASALQESGVSS